MTGYGFEGFGLRLVSDIDLPEFRPVSPVDDPDIRIRLDDAAKELCGDSDDATGAFVPAAGGGFVMRIAGVAVFHVEAGREIRIAVEPGADPGMVRLYTVGSAMGMAMHQRGILVLHGATVSRHGEARIFVGDSGAGKSTLAANLGRAGCSVLGDDTMALWNTPAGGRGVWLWQGSQVFKLWEDSLVALGMGVEGLVPLGNRTNKFYLANHGPETDSPGEVVAGLPLREIIVLETGDGPPRIEPLRGLQALQAVAIHTYRPEYVQVLGREAEHFRQCGSLTRDVEVSRLIRPWGLRKMADTLDLLLRRWAPAAVSGDAG